MNLAKEVKLIKTIYYMGNNGGILGNGYEKTFASLKIVQYNYK